MRVLDTATILAAMAQVSPRRAAAPASSAAPPGGARARAYHRPATTPPRDPGDREDGPRRPRPSSLVVVPQGVIPVIVVSTRLALAIAS